MRTTLWALACTLSFCAVLPVAAEQSAQKPGSAPPQQTAVSNADIEALKRQIQALIAAQIAVQKQLDEIKTMLRAAPAAAPAPAPAPAPVTNVDATIDIAGAPVKGAPTARVALVEFSDYECPFCARHATGTLPELAKEYIDSGKVKYVFRNLPLESIHPNALRAAIAADCAGEQGKYWPMHDRLFENQRALDAASLVTSAQALGLDLARFQQCQANDKHAARIQRDQIEAGRLGASSTPSFFVAIVTPGDSKVRAVRMIRGAQSYPTFKGALDSVLASLK